jgi:hypothetical protein
MSQADSVDTTTPSRISFASAGAVRSRYSSAALIRTGMATLQPPTGIQLNFHNMLDDLRDEGAAHNIVGVTDQSDLEEAADHLQAVLDPIVRYVKAVVSNLAYNANTNIPDETGFLADAVADIIGSLRNKGDALAVDAAA